MTPRLRLPLFALASLTLIVSLFGSQSVSAQAPAPCQPGQILIAEFRTRGPNGKFDEFVKLHNNTESACTIQASDGSGGWSVGALSGSVNSLNISQRFTIPNGTVISARGYFLGALANTGLPGNNGYSMTAFATPDAVYGTDIDDNRGIALFTTNSSNAYSASTVVDAVGFSNSASSAAALTREGTPLASPGQTNGQYSWVRRFQPGGGKLLDSNNNVSDFLFISPVLAPVNGVPTTLGMPSPQNSTDLTFPTGEILFELVPDPVTVYKRDLRVTCVMDPTVCGPNSPFGTLTIYRRIRNTTVAGSPGAKTFTKVRFRVVDITTDNSPLVCGALCPQAVIRYLDSGILPSANPIRGTNIELPAEQVNGGGVNTSAGIGSISNVIDLGANPLGPGETRDVQFVVGVVGKGYARFFINTEAK